MISEVRFPENLKAQLHQHSIDIKSTDQVMGEIVSIIIRILDKKRTDIPSAILIKLQNSRPEILTTLRLKKKKELHRSRIKYIHNSLV